MRSERKNEEENELKRKKEEIANKMKSLVVELRSKKKINLIENIGFLERVYKFFFFFKYKFSLIRSLRKIMNL
jgi:hypothetical protein